MIKQKQAFTLVELIVVITILAILGTIAFISLQGYSASSRDSVRISDVSNMKTSLELFHLNAGKYPLPDDNEIVDYAGEPLWYQGFLGTTVVSQLSRNLNEIPTDPLTDKKYIYSVSNNKNEFEILNLLEGDLALNTITQTNAATLTVIPRIDGTYNGVFIKTSINIIPVPSIITAENISEGLTLDTTNIHSQVISGGENIPNVGNVNYNTGALDGLQLVATGVITKNSTDEEKESVMKAIQDAYKDSILAVDDIYEYILSKTTTEDLVLLLDSVVLNNTTSGVIVASVVVIDNTSCKTILESDENSIDGTYTIDPEDNGVGFDVYCDMITNGGGRTMVLKSVVDNSDFYYSSSQWTNAINYNEGDFALWGGNNAKYGSYSTVTGTDFLVKFETQGNILIENLTPNTAYYYAVNETVSKFEGGNVCNAWATTVHPINPIWQMQRSAGVLGTSLYGGSLSMARFGILAENKLNQTTYIGTFWNSSVGLGIYGQSGEKGSGNAGFGEYECTDYIIDSGTWFFKGHLYIR
ncbi:MAG: fibrinogen-like YCDxxxxGGGW domain-containing protein [Candidatus Gracilibacteria bacterium]